MILNLKRISSVCLLVVAVGFTACTKKEESSTISMRFGDWNEIRAKDIAYRSKVSSLATPSAATMNLLVVSVSGAPADFKWDRHSQPNPESATPPSSVSIDSVMSGRSTIQVLAVFEGADGMEFYYGSKDADVAPMKETAVDLTITNAAATANGGKVKNGEFVGRFLPASGETPPTGRINFLFNPPSGKPMVVHQTEMFNGWVNLFSLDSNILTYSSSNAAITKLLANVSLMNDGLYNSSKLSRSMRVVVPAHWNNDSHSDGVYEMEARGGRVVNIGFFGPGAANQKVCFDGIQSSSEIASADAIDDLYTSSAHDAPVRWIGHQTPPAPNPNPAYAYIAGVGSSAFKGGVNLRTDSSCADETGSYKEFVNFISVDPLMLAHSDSIVPFRGPFRAVSTEYGYPQWLELEEQSGTTYTVTWKMLPGMADAAFGGATLFYRELTSGNPWEDSELRADDGLNCEAMAAGSFSPVFKSKSVSLASESSSISGVSNPSNLQVVVCAKDKSGKYYSSAIMGTYQSGGSTPPPTPPSNYRIIFDDGVTLAASMFSGICYAARVQALDIYGNPIVVGADTEVTLGQNGNPIGFANTSDCSSSSSMKTVTIPSGSSTNNSIIYILVMTYGANMCDVGIQPSGGSTVVHECDVQDFARLNLQTYAGGIKVTVEDSGYSPISFPFDLVFDVTLTAGCTISGSSNYAAVVTAGNSSYSSAAVVGTGCTATIAPQPGAYYTIPSSMVQGAAAF
ncbi:MAG TPA: hypothetical protein VM432_09860 [Bdellovibrionales bacterium]|nr:hypothetical protein [Bdellovibrionales bacterium]